jgi:hypothetical protein
MKTAYRMINFRPATLTLIDKCNDIISDYEGQGFDLTLRQLYYQLVSRNIIRNSDKEYNRLGSIVTDARYAGLIPWTSIIDRTRGVRANSHWGSPAEIIKSAAYSFAIDKWEGQEYYPEVWIEKDALRGVIAGVCSELDVPYLSGRGYTSASEMWASAQRMRKQIKAGRTPVVIHLGDHDPSGIDMSRDILDRLYEFEGIDNFERLALNMDQIEEFNPPPNPAKLTDSRCQGYIAKFGHSSWELDALEPRLLVQLVRDAVLRFRDEELWKEKEQEEREMRNQLNLAAKLWDKKVVKVLEESA